MTFARLRLADWVAMLAAVAVLFVMAMDWYSTPQAEEARRLERIEDPVGALGGEPARRIDEEARAAAEAKEKNAWQADATIDRGILVALLLTVGLGLLAGFLRATGRRFEPPFTPSALAALAAATAAALITVRIVQEPGPDEASTVQSAPPLAIAVLGVLALACAIALRSEEAGTAFRELPQPAQEEPPATEEEPAPR
jgi:ribose/xylose/arabinose/galactoside ABC-type transport system permease subunit